MDGFWLPRIIRSSVLFPHPEGPTSVTNSPAVTFSVRSLSTTLSAAPAQGYASLSPLTSIWCAMRIAVLRFASLVDPGVADAHPNLHQPVRQKEQQGHPEHVRDDHVHRHVAPHDEDAVPEPDGGGQAFAGDEQLEHRLQVQPDRVQH